jgi:hypothetical protein
MIKDFTGNNNKKQERHDNKHYTEILKGIQIQIGEDEQEDQ